MLRVLAFAVVCIFSSRAQAQCADPCDSIRTPADTNCGIDPNDGSMFGVLAIFCPCQANERLAAAVTYTGVDGGVTTSRSTAPPGLPQSTTSLTFSFPNTNTAIQSGSPVTVSYYQVNGNIYLPISYTYSPVRSIYFTEETDTVTSTTNTVTTTTTTATVTSTTAISQETSTVPCTTGTLTVTAPTTTIQTTSTITPPPRTIKYLDVKFTTTRAKCLPAPHKHYRDRRRELAERRYNEGTYEVPYCPVYFGPPEPTTYTTGTTVTTETVTTTDTSTAIDTSTDTITATPTPLTTTVCSNVAATTTTTPTATKTAFTCAKQQTTKTTYTITFTKTVYTKHVKPCTQTKSSTYRKLLHAYPTVTKKGRS